MVGLFVFAKLRVSFCYHCESCFFPDVHRLPSRTFLTFLPFSVSISPPQYYPDHMGLYSSRLISSPRSARFCCVERSIVLKFLFPSPPEALLNAQHRHPASPSTYATDGMAIGAKKQVCTRPEISPLFSSPVAVTLG